VTIASKRIVQILGNFHEIAHDRAHPPLKRAVISNTRNTGGRFMTHARYEAAETLVYDPVASNRNATRAALRSLGFRSVEFASTLDALRACLVARSPDLFCAKSAAPKPTSAPWCNRSGKEIWATTRSPS